MGYCMQHIFGSLNIDELKLFVIKYLEFTLTNVDAPLV